MPLPRGHQRRVRRERKYRVLGVIGGTCIGLGLLILAFAIFQFFGTGLITNGRQRALHDQFTQQLKRAHVEPVAHVLGPPRTVPTTPQPSIGQAVAEISIPKININFTVLQGTGDVQLEAGPGHYVATPLPGQLGNAAIAGHRTTWMRPFWNLNELNPGDAIYLTTTQGYFRYSVTSQTLVAPTDVAVLNPTTTATLTLSTCNPRFSATQRLIIKATLSGTWLPGDANASTTTTTTAPITPTTTPKQFVSSGSWAAAILWGIVTAAIGVGAALARRTWKRWWIYLVAAPIFVVALFLFFMAISPLLPASI